MKNKIILEDGWERNLIRCPSQIYGFFKKDDKYYCIYLRWRWCDPWRAYLVECNEDGEFIDPIDNWIELNKGMWFNHDNYEKAERQALMEVENMFTEQQSLLEKVLSWIINNLWILVWLLGILCIIIWLTSIV